MQPADTALTRVYNQPTVVGPDGRLRGTLYKNPIDCLWKTFKTEGIYGWYKGLFFCWGIFSPKNSPTLQVQQHISCVLRHIRMSSFPSIPLMITFITFQHHHSDHERHYHKSLQGSERSGVVASTAPFRF